jgi:hypothetical protein
VVRGGIQWRIVHQLHAPPTMAISASAPAQRHSMRAPNQRPTHPLWAVFPPGLR